MINFNSSLGKNKKLTNLESMSFNIAVGNLVWAKVKGYP